MMIYLYIILAILGISALITFLIVFIINKTSNDDYDEVEFAKTKTFDPNEFEDGTVEEHDFTEDVERISENLNIIDEQNTMETPVIEEVTSEEELNNLDFLENTQTKLKINDSDIKNKFYKDTNKDELEDLEKTSQNLNLNIENEDDEIEVEKPVIRRMYGLERDEEII